MRCACVLYFLGGTSEIFCEYCAAAYDITCSVAGKQEPVMLAKYIEFCYNTPVVSLEYKIKNGE